MVVKILGRTIRVFGFIYATSYEERWSQYKRQSRFGKEPFKMIPIRLWTQLDQLPSYASNCGKNGYVDEFVLHEVGNNLGFDLATTAGTSAMSFMDDEFIELAQNE